MSSLSQVHSHPKRNGSTSSNAPFASAALPAPFSPPSNTGYRVSGSSQGTRSSTSTANNPLTSSHMESTVTRLLVATKQLLESLTDWSQGRIDEGGVSDIYVRLGNEFNAASLAFTKEGIDMNDLNSVPDDLRACLEAALSEEASPATLDQHLPQIRQIVVHLLQGLKAKQAKWRAAKRQQDLELAHSPPVGSFTSRVPSRDILPPDRLMGPHSSVGRVVPVTRTLNSTKSREDFRRVAATSSSTSNDLHKASATRAASPGPYPVLRMPANEPAVHHSKPYDGYRTGPTDHSGPENPTPPASNKSRVSPVNRAVRTVNELSDRLRGTRASPPPPAPPPPPRMNYTHAHPAGYGIPIPPIPSSPRSNHQAQASSLEALRKTDTLQRRASKRFSTYTYNKIAATASPHKRTGETPIGLGINVPPMPRSPNQISRLLPQDDDGNREATEAGRELVRGAKSSEKSSLDEPSQTSGDRQPHRSPSPASSKPLVGNNSDGAELATQKPVVSPILEESESSIYIHSTPVRSPITRHAVDTTPVKTRNNTFQPTPQNLGPPTIFLQLGRDVKKVKLETPPTIASLRVLFMDRFQYSPGLDDFPAIYIRDPKSGVQYQLEDMSEVKDRDVLSLNIDVLDQVKSHIDTGLSGLARELKDLKSTVTSLRRQSVSAAASNSFVNDNLSATPSPAQRPTESQFKNAARIFHRANSNQPAPALPLDPATTNPAPNTQQAGVTGSPIPPNSAASFSELRLQQISGVFNNKFNEVQALRRELGILKQLYGTFSGEAKDLIATLRSQAEQVKQVASTKVAAPRTSINLVKSKLESRSQDLVTKIESLQDTVEDLKQDVTTRKMKPKPSTMVSVSDSITTVSQDLQELSAQIVALKPSWKKSWEEELQNIVDEQQLLNYQEDLVKDLKEDLSAVSTLFGHVKDYLDVRKVTKIKPREFFPPSNTFGGGIGAGFNNNPREGLDTVMMQVKALEPKSGARLKAIEAAERAREKNLKESSGNDEFAQELAGFVGGKKLKMTGGTEEIERLRRIKSEITLKAMISGSNNLTNEVISVSDPPVLVTNGDGSVSPTANEGEQPPVASSGEVVEQQEPTTESDQAAAVVEEEVEAKE